MQQWEYMELYLFRDVYDSSNWVDNYPYTELKQRKDLTPLAKRAGKLFPLWPGRLVTEVFGMC